MKIAVTYENGEIFQHFGHTVQFKLYDIEDGKIVNEQIVDTNCSGHGALAGFLQAAKVDALICGDMVKRSKPAPDIFLKAAEAISIAPTDGFVIEDSYNGIRAAHAAALRPIMVPDLKAPDEEMKVKTEVILPDLDVVRTYFDAIDVKL